MFLNWGLIFFNIRLKLCIFGKNTTEMGNGLYLTLCILSRATSYIKGCLFCFSQSVYLITGNNNSDHLVKVISAEFLHCKVTGLLFVIKYLEEGILGLHRYLLFPQTFVH